MELTLACIAAAVLTAYHLLAAMAGERSAGWSQIIARHEREVSRIIDA